MIAVEWEDKSKFGEGQDGAGQSLKENMGPMFGALVASVFDYRGIFIFSALLIVLNAILFNFNTKSLRK